MAKLRSEFASLQQQLSLLNHKRHDGELEAHQLQTPVPAQQQLQLQTPTLNTSGGAGSDGTSAQVLQPLQANALQGSAAQHSGLHASFQGGSSGLVAASALANAGKSSSAAMAPTVSAATAAAAAAGDVTQENLQLHGGSDGSCAAILQALRCGSSFPGSSIGQLAVEMFEESEFMALCQAALNAQLQRSAEGATSQSRILELAGAPRTCMYAPHVHVRPMSTAAPCGHATRVVGRDGAEREG